MSIKNILASSKRIVAVNSPTSSPKIIQEQNAYSSAAAASHTFQISKYQCSFCSKVFPRAWHLKNHIRVHTGVRPFVCQICNKGFNQLGNLNTHLRIHTGEKPFKCTVCNCSFLRSNDLKLHMMKKHFQ